MNSRHAEIILEIMRFLESFSEIPSVHCSFEDSVGRERIYPKLRIEFGCDAKIPLKKKEESKK